MTAWTTISNALVAVGAKPFATTVQALRDNPIAIAEGATSAPRIQLPALERLAVGTTIKVRNDATRTWNFANTNFQDVADFTPGFLQAGTVTVAFDHRVAVGSSGASEVRVVRRRAGANTTLTTISQTGTTFVSKTFDAGVQPGDVILLQQRNTSANQTVEIRNTRIQTDPSNYYWPVGWSLGQSDGNPTIT